MAYRYIHNYGDLKENDVEAPWVLGKRRMVASSGCWPMKDRCCLCGEFILKGEDYFLCYAHPDIRKNNKKYQLNFVVHADEWLDFSHGLSEEELIQKFAKLKTPRKSPYTLEQMDKIFAFEEACRKLKFTINGKDPRGSRMSHCRQRRALIYNVYYDHINLEMSGHLNFMEVNPAREARKLMQEILFKKENCIL